MTDLRTAAQQALEALIENARLLGVTQAKKGFGRYSQEDANLERAWHEGTAKHSATILAALAQQAEPGEPVATVTECEACFTPDVCQLRGTCDYYTASQMRIAALAQQAEPMGCCEECGMKYCECGERK